LCSELLHRDSQRNYSVTLRKGCYPFIEIATSLFGLIRKDKDVWWLVVGGWLVGW